MKYIALISCKGGVGKSTISLHLAHWLHAKKGHHTVIGDLDGLQSLRHWHARAQGSRKMQAAGVFDVAGPLQLPKYITKDSWVVLDTPANPDDDLLGDLLEDCAIVLIPCSLSAEDVLGATQTIERIRKWEKTEKGHPVDYRIILNKIPTTARRRRDELLSTLTEKGYRVEPRSIRQSEGVSQASYKGETVAQQTGGYRRPWLDYSAAFENIYQEIQ